MKTILTTLIATVITSATFAQSADRALARVSYSFTHVQDTTKRDKPYTENMLLVIGKNASIYTSYDKININANIQKQLQEQIKNSAGGPQQFNIQRGSSKPVSQIDYYTFNKENKFFTQERVFNSYLIEEKVPQIDWKLSKDTASFSGVKCKKATARFKGRNWIAWYAPELPFQSGPWKLNGLPGLIIEAYDDKNEVKFQFAGIENITDANTEESTETLQSSAGTTVRIGGLNTSDYLGKEIKLPANAIKTNKAELDKLKAARDADPQGFAKAQMASSGMNVNPANVSFRSSISIGGNRPVLNNPIELPETK
jgi:GLPGLI family protein